MCYHNIVASSPHNVGKSEYLLYMGLNLSVWSGSSLLSSRGYVAFVLILGVFCVSRLLCLLVHVGQGNPIGLGRRTLGEGLGTYEKFPKLKREGTSRSGLE